MQVTFFTSLKTDANSFASNTFLPNVCEQFCVIGDKASDTFLTKLGLQLSELVKAFTDTACISEIRSAVAVALANNPNTQDATAAADYAVAEVAKSVMQAFQSTNNFIEIPAKLAEIFGDKLEARISQDMQAYEAQQQAKNTSTFTAR